MYSDRNLRDGQKPPRTKPSRQKTSDKTLRQEPPRTKTNLPFKEICMYACTKKIVGEVLRYVTYFRREWFPICVTMCDRGREVKIGPK